MNTDRATAVVEFFTTLLIFGAYAAGAIVAALLLHVIYQFLRPLSEGWRERGPSWGPRVGRRGAWRREVTASRSRPSMPRTGDLHRS